MVVDVGDRCWCEVLDAYEETIRGTVVRDDPSGRLHRLVDEAAFLDHLEEIVRLTRPQGATFSAADDGAGLSSRRRIWEPT